MGVQGCGKGTQAKKLAEKFKLSHISTGDLLRKEAAKQTELGKEIQETMKKGELVPDDLIYELLEEEIKSHESFIFDGFPRTKKQAEVLDHLTKIDAIIHVDLTDEEAITRIKARVVTNKDGKEVHRKDDTLKAAEKRIAIYHKQTKPLCAYFRDHHIPFLEIDGHQSIEDVFKDILKALKEKKIQPA